MCPDETAAWTYCPVLLLFTLLLDPLKLLCWLDDLRLLKTLNIIAVLVSRAFSLLRWRCRGFGDER
ncbi:hypothetical protein PsorP6_015411 [Peronosclerospora sorghi]|uniref:Uncharacterized protein n=1 Tax=Peronosclerospora sorghi TaxID=230839 RepID=A0ACC0WNT0_9STRA|nr:hypothetical protein PsorP6_015411 [Peronosclerospora sorghi]